MDRSSRPPPSVHGPRQRAGGRSLLRAGADQVAAGRPAQHRHPGRQRHLELPGPVGGRHGEADRVHHRTRPLDDGRRHLAHRVAVAVRHRPGPRLLRGRRRHRRGHRPDQRRLQHRPAHHAAGDHAADHPPVQRLERSGRAAHDQERQPERAGAVRLRAELPAAAPVHDPGPVDAGAVRRAGPAGDGRSRAAQDAGARRVGPGRGGGAREQQRDPAGRAGPHRRHQLRRAHELVAVDASRSSTRCR